MNLKMTRNVQVLELIGLPYAGKTTLARNLEKSLELRGRKVIFLDQYNGPASISDSLKQSTDVNYIRSIKLLQCVIEQSHYDAPSIIICDRGAVDFIAWQRFFSHVAIHKNESDRLSIETLNNIVPYVKKYICLLVKTDFNLTMSRRAAHGRFFNSEIMSIMKNIYDDVMEDVHDLSVDRIITHTVYGDRDASIVSSGIISKFKLI